MLKNLLHSFSNLPFFFQYARTKQSYLFYKKYFLLQCYREMLELPLWKVQAQKNIYFFFTTIKVYQTLEQSANKHLLRDLWLT